MRVCAMYMIHSRNNSDTQTQTQTHTDAHTLTHTLVSDIAMFVLKRDVKL